MPRSAHEELAFIRQLMEDGRREMGDRGLHYMIWGLATAVGALATWLHVVAGTGPDPRGVWVGVLAAGWAASMVAGRREAGRQRVATAGGRMLAATWIATGVSLTLIGTLGMFTAGIDVRALPGLLSIVLAAPIVTMGVMTPYRWLVAVAAGWWLGGAVMLAMPGVNSLLLMAAMAVLLMAVPGAVLYAGARRRDSGSEVLSEAR